MAVDLNNLESCSVAELVALVKHLLQRVEWVESLEAENASLKEQLRASKRATAPFSKGRPYPAPKKPGRRAGERRFERRAIPVPVPVYRVAEFHEPFESSNCSRCRASLDLVEQTASMKDTLPQPVRSIRVFLVERGRHEELATSQDGATTGRIGPNMIALAATQHYNLGLPVSKVPEESLSKVEETRSGRALTFTRELKATPREPLKVCQYYRDRTSELEIYGNRGVRIRHRLDHHVLDQWLKDTDHQRLLDGNERQHDRGRVLLFLEHPEIEPTNNRAERGLRGAVIARKVSHCSKNERGARTYEPMKSVTETLALRGHSVDRALADRIQGMPIPALVAR